MSENEYQEGGPTSRRRHDPKRRDRIVAVTLDVIAEHGVAGTSHRRVAAVADVPLGSMTYHFDGMDDLLQAAFERFTQSIASIFKRRLSEARTQGEARLAVVELICGGLWATPRNMALTFELYAYINRNPDFRRIMSGWMLDSRQALSLHFDAATARALDMAIEGATIHNVMDADVISRAEVERIVDRLSGKT